MTTTASTISFPSAEGEAPAYYARPGQGVPGVVVIQEWWGLVPHIEDITRRFAAQGYLALAPDLYHGKRTVEAEEARHLIEGLDWKRATAEIAGAVGYLRKQGATRVGIVGYCVGGALAVTGAAQANVSAYVSYYGFPPAGSVNLGNVASSGLIFFGEHESRFSISDAQAFARTQAGRGFPTEVVVYPGAGHGFFNDTHPEKYSADAANDAWRRTLAFFGEQLRG